MNQEIPYFPFTGEVYKPQMGIKPLNLAEWIEIDDKFRAQIKLKTKLVKTETDSVLQIRDSANDAVFELYNELKSHLLSVFPDKYTIENDCFNVLVTGGHFEHPKSATDALIHMAQWTQEDFCLLSATSPVILEAGCVCFPSRWSLIDKIGKGSDAIHEPVPKFHETVGASAAHFLDKLQIEKPMWRMNWTIHDSDHLYCPVPMTAKKNLTVKNVIDNTFLRVERQTLRRLKLTNYIVFSIRTYITPISVVMYDSEKRTILKKSLENLPIESAEYKGMKYFFNQLKEAL